MQLFPKMIAIFSNNRIICNNIEGPIGDFELFLQCASSAPGAALVSEFARVVSSQQRAFCCTDCARASGALCTYTSY
jgi:hypothetical protein